MTQRQRSKAARALGQKGGAVRSKAKAEAARANGAKGGRPRKAPPAFVRELQLWADTPAFLDRMDAWADSLEAIAAAHPGDRKLAKAAREVRREFAALRAILEGRR